MALAIGLVTITLVSLTFSLVTGNPLNLREEMGVFLFQVLMVAAPFGVLSLGRVHERTPWLVGLALTAAFWGYYLFEGISYQLSGDRSGVDFGLAFLMMLSPVVIAACSLGAAKLTRQRS